MQVLQDVLKKANIIPRLQLAVKLDGGGTDSTGPHQVKLIDAKTVMGTDYQTGKERYEVQLSVEEHGIKKTYNFPVKNKQGGVHYLVERLAPYPEGSVVILEAKKQKGSFKHFISVTPVSDNQLQSNGQTIPTNADTNPIPNGQIKDEDIPIIEQNEPEDADIQ